MGYALAAHPERIAALIASGAIGPRNLDTREEQLDREQWAELARQRGLGALIKEEEEAEGNAFPIGLWGR